jgi:hypothetical protein
MLLHGGYSFPERNESCYHLRLQIDQTRAGMMIEFELIPLPSKKA